MHEQPLLRFVQVLPGVSTDGNFSLRDLPGGGKRIDILCRDLAACFDWGPSTWSRQNLQLIAILGDSVSLRFSCPPVIPVGETGWACVIRDSLRGCPPDYVCIDQRNTRQVIEEIIRTDMVTVLEEHGSDLVDIRVGDHIQNSFIIGDHRGFNEDTDHLLKEYTLSRVSLGPLSYLSSHCIGIIISYFERMMGKWARPNQDLRQKPSQDLSRR